MSILLIVLIVVVVLAGIIAGFFNKLVRLRMRSKEAWSDIDVQLKRRYDLIPNLIEAVKGYAAHEKEIFEKVAQARAAAMGATSIDERGKAENALSQSLKSLFAVSENYPDLKASESFLNLQKELTDAEDKVQAARRFYNANVRDLNIVIESFPSNIFAKIFVFKKMDLFEIEEAVQREVPKVQF
jgi:LemA protein